ncbi:hypothetical protein FRC03_000652 [Tulasnella sp. 419]|nr:hypothetical protein FRC03_000652 [Tulasnella sp. 419]
MAAPFSHSDAEELNRQFEERKAHANAEMARLMDEATLLVRGKTEQVGNDVLRPAYQGFQSVAKEYPTTTLFLTVFALLSIIPVAIFLYVPPQSSSLSILTRGVARIFAIIILCTFILGAVTVAVMSAGAIIGIAASILLFVLSFTTGTAAFATFAYISFTVTSRLLHHLSDKDGNGISGWLDESLKRFGLEKALKGRSSSYGSTEDHTLQGGHDDARFNGTERERLSEEWDHTNHPYQSSQVKPEHLEEYKFPSADAPGIM